MKYVAAILLLLRVGLEGANTETKSAEELKKETNASLVQLEEDMQKIRVKYVQVSSSADQANKDAAATLESATSAEADNGRTEVSKSHFIRRLQNRIFVRRADDEILSSRSSWFFFQEKFKKAQDLLSVKQKGNEAKQSRAEELKKRAMTRLSTIQEQQKTIKGLFCAFWIC